MNPHRAVKRRLDPWAAVLLGVLIALGIIILLATPGPWRKVVPVPVPLPHVQLAPPPPRDVAVFVSSPDRAGRCTGVVWVHLRYDLPTVTAVVIPTRLECLIPGAGYQRVGRIVAEAGSAMAATALGDSLGVTFGGWLSLGRASFAEAFPGLIAQSETHAGRVRLRALIESWNKGGDPTRTPALQARSLDAGIAGWRARDFNLIAFTNYVLGSPDALTDMKLQALSAIGGVIAKTTPAYVTVSGLPTIVYARQAYQRWVPGRGVGLILGAAFAVDATSPTLPASVQGRAAGDKVLVLTEPLGRRLTAQYAAGLRARLGSYGCGAVRVEVVACRTSRDVVRALRVRPGAPPPLAAVVAFGRTRSALSPVARATELSTAAFAGLSALRVPLIFSEVPAGPLDSDLPNATIDQRGTALGVTVSVGAASVAPGDLVGATLEPRGARRWGEANAATLARAIQPAFFAPGLPATRLDFSFYRRRQTNVAIIGGADVRAADLAVELQNAGWQARRLAGTPSAVVTAVTVTYAGGQRQAALALAGDLGIGKSAVAAGSDLPAPLTVALPSAH